MLVELLAVVACREDDRVVEEAPALERIENPTHELIGIGDGVAIAVVDLQLPLALAETPEADGGCVRPIARRRIVEVVARVRRLQDQHRAEGPATRWCGHESIEFFGDLPVLVGGARAGEVVGDGVLHVDEDRAPEIGERERERGEHAEAIAELLQRREQRGPAALRDEGGLRRRVQAVEHAEDAELGRVPAAHVVTEDLRCGAEAPEMRCAVGIERVGTPAVDDDPDDVRARADRVEPERSVRVVR